jgi:hypothetical protein
MGRGLIRSLFALVRDTSFGEEILLILGGSILSLQKCFITSFNKNEYEKKFSFMQIKLELRPLYEPCILFAFTYEIICEYI